MASTVNPTIVLVQGSFQTPGVYRPFAKTIESHGFPVIQPALPSLTGQDEPGFASKTLADDAQVVETAVRHVVQDEEKTVIMVLHSYGGLVGTEAVPEELTREKRRQQGLPGGVAHLFYSAAFVLPKGQSIRSAVGDDHPHEIHRDGRFAMREPGKTMYNDLPPDEAQAWAAKTVEQSVGVKSTILTRCAWSYVPSTYAISLKDAAVPVEVQKMFAKTAGSDVRYIEAGHSAMLSKPEELINLIQEAIRKAKDPMARP